MILLGSARKWINQVNPLACYWQIGQPDPLTFEPIQAVCIANLYFSLVQKGNKLFDTSLSPSPLPSGYEPATSTGY